MPISQPGLTIPILDRVGVQVIRTELGAGVQVVLVADALDVLPAVNRNFLCPIIDT